MCFFSEYPSVLSISFLISSVFVFFFSLRNVMNIAPAHSSSEPMKNWEKILPHRTWTWKNSDYPTRLGWILCYIGHGREKYSSYYSSRFDFRYIGLELENCSDNLTGVRLILWYIGLGLKETIGLPYWTRIDFIIY